MHIYKYNEIISISISFHQFLWMSMFVVGVAVTALIRTYIHVTCMHTYLFVSKKGETFS